MSTSQPQSRGTRDWDAGSYDRLADPLTRRGVAVIDRLDLRGDETVLDAGCGTGRVTAILRERLPDGRLLALDGSAAMLERARANVGHERASYIHADLEAALPIEDATCGAILSTSTLHWIARHDDLFREFARVLQPGGRLAIDCGGSGNASVVVDALERVGETWNPWNFAGVDETERRLASAGFVDLRVWLAPDPVVLPPDRLREYLRTVVLGAHLERLSAARGAQLVARVADALPEPRIDYVRLNVSARRPPADHDR